MTNDSYIGGFMIITAATAVAVFGQLTVRHLVDNQKLKDCHDVGGQFLAVVGTMYAVLLGLVVVDAMSHFQEASVSVEQEANSLADIFLLAERLPRDRRDKIQILCQQYADQVIDQEWPAMDDSRVFLPARKSAIELMKTTMDYEPVKESEKAVYPIMVQEVCQLWDNRRMRTNAATRGMPLVEWVVLIVGGIVTVVFTYFFHVESIGAQVAMTTMVTLIIGLNLFLVLLFGYPFSGDLTVSPDAFKLDQLIFQDKLGMRKTENNLD
ncbi:MAG: DUF4239 domain-containing protein [Cyanobacteria bacterium SZAS-4]|nr:DUF4239 domain-containing protein [Cyanobacteria bacterium SZAS-4]